MENNLYNKDLKLAFINNYIGEEGTKNTILFEFLKTAKVEKQYDKDLFAFHDREIEDLLYSLARDNIMSLHKSVSIYKNYINWCIVNGQRGIYENGENRMEIFQKTEELTKYISNRKVENRFLTKDELNDLIDYLVNPIDQALMLSLYEFIGGEGLHEIRMLKLTDVNMAEKTVRLEDSDGNIREQNISNKLIELLKDANNQKRYIGNNGVTDRIKGTTLNQTEYIFRVMNKGQSEDAVSYRGLISKIQNIKNFTGYDFITVNSLKESRIIHEIADVMSQLELDKPDEDTYKIATDNIYDIYGIELTYMQMYSIKQKYEHVISLKDFN